MAAFEKLSTIFSQASISPQRYYESRHPFWVIVQKEVMDHINSWRFVILLSLMFLTTIASLYTAMSSLQSALAEDTSTSFVFLKLFTATDGTLPPFITFISLLGPIIGIALGFDAVNSERSRGTLSRLLAQPIPRDYIINAKLVASLIVVTIMIITLGLSMIGFGILLTGIPPTPEEFWRVFFFLLVSIIYIGVWLNLAIMFSVRFKQSATSALSSLAVWLFFSLFYSMIVNIIVKATAPTQVTDAGQIIAYQGFVQNLLRISPSQLFSEATSTLLVPTIRTLGPITVEQAWCHSGAAAVRAKHTFGLAPVDMPCGCGFIIFGLSYVLFMKQEVRPARRTFRVVLL